MKSTQQVLALNLGSATLKAAPYVYRPDGDSGELLPQGDRLVLSVPAGDGGGEDEAALLERVSAALPAQAISPDVIAHRIVHGGSRTGPALLVDEVIAELSGYAPMAPLHQPAALRLVEASRVRWPTARHVAVFDTTWHETLADWSRRLPIPQRLHDAGIKRYGFHGIAFQSAMRKLRELDDAADRQRIVLAHLGSGCSLCAVNRGLSVDTSMGLTPLDGLPMATRSGALDPGVVLFLGQQMKLSHAAIEHMLWQECGLVGVSGISGDMRELLDASDTASKLAVEQFVIRVAQGIVSMATGIGGIDAIVFSGGIGSHAAAIRQRVGERLAWIGVRESKELNDAGATRIEAEDSSAKIWRIEVDEEYEMALAAVTQ